MSAMYLVKDCSAGLKRTVKLVFTLHPHQFLLWIMFTSNKSDYSFRIRNCVMNQRKSNILGSLWYLLRLYRIWYYPHLILAIFHLNKHNLRYIIKISARKLRFPLSNWWRVTRCRINGVSPYEELKSYSSLSIRWTYPWTESNMVHFFIKCFGYPSVSSSPRLPHSHANHAVCPIDARLLLFSSCWSPWLRRFVHERGHVRRRKDGTGLFLSSSVTRAGLKSLAHGLTRRKGVKQACSPARHNTMPLPRICFFSRAFVRAHGPLASRSYRSESQFDKAIRFSGKFRLI